MKQILPLLFVALMTSGAYAAKQEVRTNVLFIVIDDLNDWVGCLGGHPQAHTPNIDRLAARGVLFTNAHCAAPACNPSRAAVFSGLMPYRTGVWSNNSPKLPDHRPELTLLPTSFQRAGYQTLGTGKLLHGGSKASGPLFEESFFPAQRWSPFGSQQVRYTTEELSSKGTDSPRHVINFDGNVIVLPMNGMPSDRNPRTAAAESFDWGPLEVSDAAMGDTQITDWSIQRIQQGFEKAFFLGVGYYRPHIPLWAPRRYFDLYTHKSVRLPPVLKGDLEDVPKIARQWALEPITAGAHGTVVRHGQWRDAVTAYLACISFVDHQVGRLVTALDASEYGDNTLIVLWSDHGWHLGEKRHWGKWTGWERSTRVPLIIVPPRSRLTDFARPGSTCDQPVCLIDLFPTLAEMCGVDPPDNLDGRTLVPLLRNPEARTNRVVTTLFDRGNFSRRTRNLRYIRYADGSAELYDLQKDPHEWDNLVSDPAYADELAEQRKQLTEFIRQENVE